MKKERTIPVNKDQIIQAMKDRILSEHRKYADSDVVDWAFLAAVKIYGSFVEKKSLVDKEKPPMI